MKNLNLLFVTILILSIKPLNAQMLADFETTATTPSFKAEGETAVVDNPDKTGINTSNKVGYYNKIEGNWHYVTLDYPEGVEVGFNNTLTFKIHASVQGRIFAKFWIGDSILIEDWAPEYGFKPTANTWVECKMDLTEAMGDRFTTLELAACVDNNEEAEVYFDDIQLSNPEVGDGSPKVIFSVSNTKILEGETVTFDASKSYDYDGQIASYSWNFGDGTSAQGVKVEHTYTSAQNAKVVLTLTDNDAKKSSDSTVIFVFAPDEKISAPVWLTKNPAINEKIEALFQINASYNNVFDPDEVMVDALITAPNGNEIMVPCFYYVKSYVSNTEWVIDSSFQGWVLRFSTPQIGEYSLKFKVSDNAGTFISESYQLSVNTSNTKGIIRNDAQIHQYYRHETGEPFAPTGINLGWASIADYTQIIKNLANGKANLFRYWHTPFAQQALEWSTDSFYSGLGRYSQQAAAMTDSLINLSEATNTNMQLVIFQHGMFSENVNEMWQDNPYNKANGGFVDRAEEYFYNDQCKAQTKKLLRYIVARWGYSKNIFAWEFFNEVQFTGIHPQQSSKWFPGVLTWHSEMSQYVQSIDAFNHIMTTSAEHNQIPKFDSISAMDNIQYHLYSNELLSDQKNLDYQFQDELKHLSIINGEYGTNSEAVVPFNMQRHAIWNGIITQVPHYMWLWEPYKDQEWANLFKMPSEFLVNEDFAHDGPFTGYTYEHKHSITTLQTLGTTNGTDFYGYVYDEFNRENISGLSIELKNIPFANYTITYYLPVNNQVITIDSIPLIQLTNKLTLPDFSMGMAFKIKYHSNYTLPIAIAGNDTIVAPGMTVNFSGHQSLSQVSGTTLSFLWAITKKPTNSNLAISNPTQMDISVVPDVSGIYNLSLIVNDGFNSSTPDVVEILVSNPPVAVVGNDTTIKNDKKYFYINGTASFDSDGDALTYLWKLLEWPAGSKGNLLDFKKPTAILPIDALGTYKAQLVVNDGISNSQPAVISIMVGPTGVDITPAFNLIVYPNPSNGSVYISADANIETVQVIDFSGRIMDVKTGNNSMELELNLHELNLKPGIYIIKVSSGSRVEYSKIVLNK